MSSIIMWTIIVISSLINLFLIWYCRNLIKFVKMTTEDFTSLQDSIDSYKKHLSKVYGLETFYGDQTLKGLLQHTKDISGDVGDFIQINTNLLYGEDDG